MRQTVLVRFKAKPGCMSKAVSLLCNSRNKALEQDACSEFRILVGDDDPDSIFLVEVWTCRREHSGFVSDILGDPFVQQQMDCFELGPEILYLREY